MRSMTGYGKAEVSREERTVSIELKAVNHRFLDLNIKMPKLFNFCEDRIRKQIQASLSRGHIDVYITYHDLRKESAAMRINENVAATYFAEAQNFCQNYNVPFNLGAAELLRLPEVLLENVQNDSEEILWELVNEAMGRALTCLNEMREKEGESLRSEFSDKLSAISTQLERVEKRSPFVAQEYREKLKVRLKEALESIALDETKLINEVAFFVDRACIDEEIARLKAHLTHFADILTNKEPIGRKLDFLIQEMNRETNTIGSKSNDLIITEQVVLMKSEIEKLREQIQNIE